MQPGFQSRIVFAATNQDGRNWKLTHPMVYRTRDGRVFVVPVGAPTDGASTPAIAASILPPTGDYWQSAVLHDAAYRGDLQMLDGTKAMPTKEECDLLLKEAMELSGVESVIAETIYEGVRLGGHIAFNEDRA